MYAGDELSQRIWRDYNLSAFSRRVKPLNCVHEEAPQYLADHLCVVALSLHRLASSVTFCGAWSGAVDLAFHWSAQLRYPSTKNTEQIARSTSFTGKTLWLFER